VPRIYRGDHTAHIRQRLVGQLRHFAGGVVGAALAAGFNLVLLPVLVGAPGGVLGAVVWVMVLVLAGTGMLGMALTGVQYLLYRRNRAEVDAAGAEVMGELAARMHRRQGRHEP
jgi:hypothetical protein